MYRSPSSTATKDLNLPYTATAEPFGLGKVDSNLQREHPMSSGLLRFSSAPSSLLSEVCDDFLPVAPSSPETESFFTRFLAQNPRDKSGGSVQSDALFTPASAEQSGAFTSVSSQMFYQSQQKPVVENAYHVVNSMEMEADQMKHSSAVSANLIRQSSSPAGFFSYSNVDSGFGLTRGMTGLGTDLRSKINFFSRQNSLSQISEIGSEGISASGGGGGGSLEESSNGRRFIPGYADSSWEDSLLSETFSASGVKRPREFVGLNQTEHQFSLPKTSSDMAGIQDSVPCKIRAKRGFATHPRSIAERVRRTRISERMRKLQELVPNMDKQTNTADMLDLAVDHIKDLQRQVKLLSDSRSTCTCSGSKQKP